MYIGKDLSKSFTTQRGHKQGDNLSCNLFNILLEMVVRDAAVNRISIIFPKSHMMLAYADDIDIMGQTLRHVTAAIADVKKKIIQNGLFSK